MFFEYEPALIHGDLAPYHILFDPAKGEVSCVLYSGSPAWEMLRWISAPPGTSKPDIWSVVQEGD
jgi:hypothetical protein